MRRTSRKLSASPNIVLLNNYWCSIISR
jgi:hypothetical protein